MSDSAAPPARHVISAPLAGRSILVTRPETGSLLSSRLSELGADVVDLPVTRLERLPLDALRTSLSQATPYDWLVVTSANAARVLIEELRALEMKTPALAGSRVCAVGPATADALLAAGFGVDLMPEHYSTEGLLESLTAAGSLRGARFLHPTAAGASAAFANGLAAAGARVDVVALYRSVVNDSGAGVAREQLARGRIDLVTFTAGSTVRGFVSLVGEGAARRVPALTIGPRTTAIARAAGFTVAAEASEATVAGMVAAAIHWATAGGRAAG